MYRFGNLRAASAGLTLRTTYTFSPRLTLQAYAQAFVAALRYLCVADGTHARKGLGFRPIYSTRDAVLDFEGALRLREARLLHEAT